MEWRGVLNVETMRLMMVSLFSVDPWLCIGSKRNMLFCSVLVTQRQLEAMHHNAIDSEMLKAHFLAMVHLGQGPRA